MSLTPHIDFPPDRDTPEAVLHLLRLANALTDTKHRPLAQALVGLAEQINNAIAEAQRVSVLGDRRGAVPFDNASEEELEAGAYIAIGAYTETPEAAQKRESRTAAYLMLERYFAWCQAIWEEVFRLDEKARKQQLEEAELDPLNVPEYKVGAFLGHALVALCPVIEGWEELKLQDDTVDALMAEGADKDYRTRLFRFRHGVVHFQRRTDDPRFTSFMDADGEARLWAIKLQRAFERFFRYHAERDRRELSEWIRR